MKTTYKIAVIGLGYVGLPLAIAFGKEFQTIGYDIKKSRIEDLKKGLDEAGEHNKDEILNSNYLSFSNRKSDLSRSNVYVIAVPTPVDEFNTPDSLNCVQPLDCGNIFEGWRLSNS